MPSPKRLKILSTTEIEELYGLPTFTLPEQEEYFSLDPDVSVALSKRITIASKVHLILQLGYFKATSQFFNVDFSTIQSDINYILKTHFPKEKLSKINVSKKTRHLNQNTILDFLGYSGDKLNIKRQIASMLKEKILHCSNPVYLFHEIMSFSDQHKLMLIAYSSLQDLIGKATIHEEQRLNILLEQKLSASANESIESLLNSNEDGYLLSALKKDPKSFKPKEIAEEIKKQKMNYNLFKETKSLLPKLELSQKNIQYYAQLAVHYPIHKLKLLSSSLRSTYTLCFIYHRYHRISDNLMVSFFHYIEKYKGDAKKAARDVLVDNKLEIIEDSKQGATVLRFFDDEDIPDADQFGEVRKRAHKHIKKGQFSLVADYLDGILFDYQKSLWQEVLNLRYKIRNNLRPIFTSLDFSGVEGRKDLVESIVFLKSYFSASKSQKPGLPHLKLEMQH